MPSHPKPPAQPQASSIGRFIAFHFGLDWFPLPPALILNTPDGRHKRPCGHRASPGTLPGGPSHGRPASTAEVSRPGSGRPEPGFSSASPSANDFFPTRRHTRPPPKTQTQGRRSKLEALITNRRPVNCFFAKAMSPARYRLTLAADGKSLGSGCSPPKPQSKAAPGNTTVRLVRTMRWYRQVRGRWRRRSDLRGSKSFRRVWPAPGQVHLDRKMVPSPWRNPTPKTVARRFSDRKKNWGRILMGICLWVNIDMPFVTIRSLPTPRGRQVEGEKLGQTNPRGRPKLGLVEARRNTGEPIRRTPLNPD